MSEFELHHQFFLEYFFRCNNPEFPDTKMPVRMVRAKCSELLTRIEALLDELSVPDDKDFVVYAPGLDEPLQSSDVIFWLNDIVKTEVIEAINIDKAMLTLNQAAFLLYVGQEFLTAFANG